MSKGLYVWECGDSRPASGNFWLQWSVSAVWDPWTLGLWVLPVPPRWSRKALSSQFSTVAQSCPTLCDPVGYSIPGFPVHHQLPELIQTHVHQVDYGIQSSHPLLSPLPLAFNLSQHQGLFQWISSSHQGPKYWSFSSVLPMNIQDWFPLGSTGWISLQAKGLSRVFSNTTVQSINSSALNRRQSNSHIHTWLLEKTIAFD